MGVAPVLLVLILRDEPPRAPEEFKRVLGALARRPSHVVLRLAGLAAAVAALLDANPELDADPTPTYSS